MADLVEPVVLAFAIFYVLRALLDSPGPFNVFTTARKIIPDCSVCLSLWIAVIIIFIQALEIPYIVETLAVAGIASLIYSWAKSTEIYVG